MLIVYYCINHLYASHKDLLYNGQTFIKLSYKTPTATAKNTATITTGIEASIEHLCTIAEEGNRATKINKQS